MLMVIEMNEAAQRDSQVARPGQQRGGGGRSQARRDQDGRLGRRRRPGVQIQRKSIQLHAWLKT